VKIAVIPARGGSKRIPGKNIRSFCEKPIIAWSIIAAKRSKCFDRIIVSTDDPIISKIAVEYGAEVPFVRPAELSDDHTGTTSVIAHAINWLISQGDDVNLVCCIYATAPFIRINDLKKGLKILNDSGADFAFSVTSYAFPVQRAIRILENNRVQMFNQNAFEVRSQDLEDAWHDAGQFYWGKAIAWLSHKPIFSSDSVPVFLPRNIVQDIDTIEDWEEAELKFSVLGMLDNKNES
jgi:pseudaminic acid cytidylyltransferase